MLEVTQKVLIALKSNVDVDVNKNRHPYITAEPRLTGNVVRCESHPVTRVISSFTHPTSHSMFISSHTLSSELTLNFHLTHFDRAASAILVPSTSRQSYTFCVMF